MDMQSFLTQVIGTLIAGAGVYAAIRADLSQINARLRILEEALKAKSDRIDRLVELLISNNKRD